jgi:hypothetical protein
MRKHRHLWAVPFIALLFSGASARAAGPDDYPGVYAGDDSLVFVQEADEQGGLRGVVVLSYEFSMDWVITAGRIGVITESGLLLTDGHQYVYNADGSRRSETEFTSLEMAVEWASLEFRVLPSDAHYLAPMVRGGLAYALVETRSGLPAQLALAREAFDTGQTLNLFEGFLYQLSDGVLTAQVAFTEMAFGSTGLIRGRFPEDFPPPPEGYPSPYPAYPAVSYPPPGGTPPAETPPSGFQGGAIDPSLPQGTVLPPEEIVERPRFTLEPMHDYDVPPILRIGLVAFRSTAEIEGYGPVCDEVIQEELAGIEGVEPVYIPFDEAQFGGAVMYDRAAWLCGEHGVDAIILSRLNTLEIPGEDVASHVSRTIRVQVDIDSRLIEGVGGSVMWQAEVDTNELHDYYEVERSRDDVLRNELRAAIQSLVSDLVSSEALKGGHVD